MIKEVEIVLMIIGRDCFPVCKITPRFMPNPSRTTAVCKIILDVHLIPDSAVPFSVQKQVITIPARIAMTGPPITGNAFPISQDVITDIRIETACNLLKNTNLSLKEISAKVGYSNQYYFSSCFKKKTGQTPSSYRQQNLYTFEIFLNKIHDSFLS